MLDLLQELEGGMACLSAPPEGSDMRYLTWAVTEHMRVNGGGKGGKEDSNRKPYEFHKKPK